MGQLQRTAGLTNAALTIIAAPPAARTLNPHRIEIVNPDVVDHTVDILDASTSAILWTIPAPRGGMGYFEWGGDGDVAEIAAKITAGGAVQAQSRDAIVASNMEVLATFGRL